MKLLLSLLCITSLFLSGCFQEKTTPIREYYDNGNPKIIGNNLEKTGNKHGEWTYYFEDGKLMRTEKYEDGKIISKKGLTKIEKVFEKEELGWNREPLNGVGFIDENDKKSGEWKFYRDNGKLWKIGSYKDDKQVGEWKSYYDNGKLEQIGSWNGSKREGEWKKYHKNGNLDFIGSFNSGKPEGELKYYNKNGKLGKIEHWKNDKLIKEEYPE